jgi:hypothetical protein
MQREPRIEDHDMIRHAKRSQVVVLAGLCLSLATVSCGGDQTTTELAPSQVETTTTRPDPLAVEAVDAGTRARILDDMRQAIDALYAEPVEITLEMSDGGEPETAVLRVDRSAGLLEGTWIDPLDGGATVTTRHVVVDERVFFKSTTSPEAEAALDFTEFPYDTIGPELFDEVYAGYARVNKTLDRNLVLLEHVPFAAEITDVGTTTEISVTMSPFAIYDYYGASGLEVVGGDIHPEHTRLTFRIEDGVLRGVVASGTLFHDGEALELSATIAFEPIGPFTLEIPPIQG